MIREIVPELERMMLDGKTIRVFACLLAGCEEGFRTRKLVT